jgi:signal transduction histidine kinase
MTLNEFLPILTNTTLILLAIITLLEFSRNRRKGYLDVALMFWGLALISIFNMTQSYLTGPIEWLSKVPSLLLVAHPYLLLRLVKHLRPIPLGIQIIGAAGMIASLLLILVLPSPLSPVFAVLIVIYFVFIEIYASVAMIRGAWKTSGVTQKRLHLAATGSVLLAAVIIIAGINVVFPPAAAVLSPLSQVVGVLAIFSYYLGFATPAWMRRSWQYTELYRYLQQRGSSWHLEPLEVSLERLCVSSAQSVGGFAAAVLLKEDGPQNRYQVRMSTDSSIEQGLAIPFQSGFGKIFQRGKAAIIVLKGEQDQKYTHHFSPPQTSTILAVPLATQEKMWGFMLVFLWHEPLFPEDDLALLKLYSEQKSIILGYLDLLEKQKKYSTELELKVAERTGQLETVVQDLEKEILARQETAKELESFAYSVSHDLRAPLRAIDGFSQILLNKYTSDLSEDAQGYFDRIIKNVQQMGQLIDDLLAFSRLGRQAMNFEQVLPSAIVQTALKRLEHEFVGRDIEFIIGDLPECMADPQLLTQVYINLLSNSMKFTRKRQKACIEIGSKSENGEIIYYVKDNGVGFSMEYADKLFGVFQRLHTSNEYEGSGVGLANIQRIIQRHGGRVWGEGVEDVGANFYFALPVNPKFPMKNDSVLRELVITSMEKPHLH